MQKKQMQIKEVEVEETIIEVEKEEEEENVENVGEIEVKGVEKVKALIELGEEIKPAYEAERGIE